VVFRVGKDHKICKLNRKTGITIDTANKWNVLETKTGREFDLDFKKMTKSGNKIVKAGRLIGNDGGKVVVEKTDGTTKEYNEEVFFPYRGNTESRTTEVENDEESATVDTGEADTIPTEEIVEETTRGHKRKASEDQQDESLPKRTNTDEPEEETTEEAALLAESKALENDELNVYLTTIPRSQHREPESFKAKIKELDDFKKFKAYDVVKIPPNNKLLPCQWILTEKDEEAAPGKAKRKARLCVEGNREENLAEILTDSPTVSKSSIRLLVTLAATNPEWNLMSSDVTRAFLQSAELNRDIYVKPPREANVPDGMCWKLRITVYGLKDASRGFYTNQGEKLIGLGMEMCRMDPALFFYFNDGSNILSEDRKLAGILGTHVDDSLTLGNENFRQKIMKPMMKKFVYGSHSETPFTYTGMKVKKEDDAITLDQDNYVKKLEIPGMNHVAGHKMDDIIEDQSLYRSIVAKLTMLSVISRPDICFESKLLSSRYGKATKKDFCTAVKLLTKAKSESTKMTYRNLGNMEDWMLLVFSDASLGHLGVIAVGGQVLIMVNIKTGNSAIFHWRSKQIRRVVHSSEAAEAYALLDAFGDAFYFRNILTQLLGSRASKIPAIAMIDCKNLWESIHNLKPVEDKALMKTIVEIKEFMAMDSVVQEVRLVPAGQQLADGLTKQGQKSCDLMKALQTGKYYLPGGFVVKKYAGVFSRTWFDLSGQKERERQLLQLSLNLTQLKWDSSRQVQ
jgi:hypothetical protein